MRDYYVMHGDTYGHMSPEGNNHVANLLFDAIQQDHTAPPPRAPAGEVAAKNPDMPVYEQLEDRLQPSTIVDIAKLGNSLSSSYRRLTLIGPKGEHYVGIGGLKSPPGVTTFSILVRFGDDSVPEAERPRIRIQLWDSEGQGVLADFDLTTGEAALERSGLARRLRSSITSEGWNWKRLTVSGKFAGPDRTVYIQFLTGDGKTTVEAKGQTIEVSDLKLY